MCLAAALGCDELIEELCKKKLPRVTWSCTAVDVTGCRRERFSPLHLTALQRHYCGTALLLAASFDLFQRSAQNITPADLVEDGSPQPSKANFTMDTLLQRACGPPPRAPRHQRAVDRAQQSMRSFLDSTFEDLCGDRSKESLSPRVVTFLTYVAAQAAPGTMRHRAVVEQRASLVSLLQVAPHLRPPNAIDTLGELPLRWAISANNVAVVEVLLAHGAPICNAVLDEVLPMRFLPPELPVLLFEHPWNWEQAAADRISELLPILVYCRGRDGVHGLEVLLSLGLPVSTALLNACVTHYRADMLRLLLCHLLRQTPEDADGGHAKGCGRRRTAEGAAWARSARRIAASLVAEVGRCAFARTAPL